MSAGDELCPPRYWDDGTLLRCGRVVLQRDPTGPEACPSYGGGGLFVCNDCVEIVGGFMRRAYDARARRKEWELEDYGPMDRPRFS